LKDTGMSIFCTGSVGSCSRPYFCWKTSQGSTSLASHGISGN